MSQDTYRMLEDDLYAFTILWLIMLSTGFILYSCNKIFTHQFPSQTIEH